MLWPPRLCAAYFKRASAPLAVSGGGGGKAQEGGEVFMENTQTNNHRVGSSDASVRPGCSIFLLHIRGQ